MRGFLVALLVILSACSQVATHKELTEENTAVKSKIKHQVAGLAPPTSQPVYTLET